MVVAVVTGEDTVQMCQGVPAVVGEAGRVGPWETDWEPGQLELERCTTV